MKAQEYREQDYLNWLYPPEFANQKELSEENKEHCNRRLDYESHKRGFDAAMAYQAERVEKLVEGINKVIEMNRTEALHRYGNKEKAEDWACVVVLRKALEEYKSGSV